MVMQKERKNSKCAAAAVSLLKPFFIRNGLTEPLEWRNFQLEPKFFLQYTDFKVLSTIDSSPVLVTVAQSPLRQTKFHF